MVLLSPESYICDTTSYQEGSVLAKQSVCGLSIGIKEQYTELGDTNLLKSQN